MVIGFALQDTLGNLFAGLAIQIEKPFRVGHWVHIAGKDGMVHEITWRATKIRTQGGQPGDRAEQHAVEGTRSRTTRTVPLTRLESGSRSLYDDPPDDVQGGDSRAHSEHEPMIARQPKLDVVIVNFADSAIIYRARVWIDDYRCRRADDDARATADLSHVSKTRLLTIPHPIAWRLERGDDPHTRPIDDDSCGTGTRCRRDFRAALSAERSRNSCAAAPHLSTTSRAKRSFARATRAPRCSSSPRRRQRDRSSRRGRRSLGSRAGGFFGEMSLLTGEPRNATGDGSYRVRSARDHR